MVIFPQNGRVLIIDDKIQHAQAIMKMLSKNKVKYSYFSGSLGDIPNPPMNDVRIIFLDLQLMNYPEPEKDANHDIEVLKKVISDNNNLYILLIWSRNIITDLGEIFISKIRGNPGFPKPLITIELSKSDYFRTENDHLVPIVNEEDSLNKIQNEIITQLSEQHFFHVYSYWDNIVSDSISEIINSFSKISDDPTDTNKQIWSLLYELAEAYSGEDNLDVSQKNIVISNALLTFNGAFIDSLESNLRNSTYPNEIFPSTERISIKNILKAKINRKILTSQQNLSCIPGAVFFDGDDVIKNKIIDEGCAKRKLKEIFCNLYKKTMDEVFNSETKAVKKEFIDDFNKFKQSFKSDCQLICCEVTPSCDYAQNKLKMNRFIHGILWPDEFSECLHRYSKFLYISPPIEFNDKIYRMVFDVRFFHAKKTGELNGKIPKFRLRHEILVDIQSHLASHVHRPGVTALEGRKPA
jgi:hypothetical protein